MLMEVALILFTVGEKVIKIMVPDKVVESTIKKKFLLDGHYFTYRSPIFY